MSTISRSEIGEHSKLLLKLVSRKSKLPPQRRRMRSKLPPQQLDKYGKLPKLLNRKAGCRRN
jgi:hypothetical protein